MTTDNFCFYLQNRLIQTRQTGGQRYSDTSPFSIPCSHGQPLFIYTSAKDILDDDKLIISHNRSSRPAGGQDHYDGHQHPTLQSRNSMGNGNEGQGNTFHSKVVSGMRSRPSSIHSSPGSSRPCSPQTVSSHPGVHARKLFFLLTGSRAKS